MYWLIKTEPEDYSWSNMVSDVVTKWSGVRNHQAQNNLRAMKTGEFAFFYHTGANREIVGIVVVEREFYYDSSYVVVDFKCVAELHKSVSLRAIKQSVALVNMSIIKQPRLSVAPVSLQEWLYIVKLSE